MEEKRILVCEDEDAIRDFVVIHLKRSGYDVFDVDSGDKAIEAWKSGKRFDVALLDIMMPGTDGTQVCRFLRSESSTIGIIMLSAKSQEMDKVNCLMMGAIDDIIEEPHGGANEDHLKVAANMREKIRIAYNEQFDYLERVAKEQNVPVTELANRDNTILTMLSH